MLTITDFFILRHIAVRFNFQKLTILMCLGKNLGDDFDANLLLPISAIENDQLKMADLLDATDEDGWSNDFLPGFNPFAV